LREFRKTITFHQSGEVKFEDEISASVTVLWNSGTECDIDFPPKQYFVGKKRITTHYLGKG